MDACSLQAVKLPEALSEIGAETFMDCTALGHIDIPQGVKEIGDYAFTACIALDNIVLPEGLTSIGAYAFDLTVDKDGNGNFFNPDPRLASINIPSTVTSVGDNFLGGVKPDGETLLISQVPDPSILRQVRFQAFQMDTKARPYITRQSMRRNTKRTRTWRGCYPRRKAAANGAMPSRWIKPRSAYRRAARLC